VKISGVARYRLEPSSEQLPLLGEHCRHARLVWNLAVEQFNCYDPAKGPAPGYVDQARQLTEARAEFAWLRAGAQMVQQQALRDFDRARRNFFAGTHRRPTWRKQGRHEGFRIVAISTGHVRRLNRSHGVVWIPKVGWVRFRWSRQVPSAVSYRVTLDRAGRWHVAFAARPDPIPAPDNQAVVGVDRGVAVAAALSTGELLTCPGLRPGEAQRLLRLQRSLARSKRGSNRRSRIKTAIGRLNAREVDRRRNWVERTSTDLARRFDVIRVEDLHIRAMTRTARGTVEEPGRNVAAKAGLNRGILTSGWGQLVTRLEHKARGRVEKINPAYTSQTCSVCGIVDAKARESQAVFACRSCRYTDHADVNAARNIAQRTIAAGRAVTARGDLGTSRSTKREPHPAHLLSA